MANRYIIHGAAVNGDGTASNVAANPGEAGAWNTITYFEGTTPAYGTLPAGTTVYIRSKTAAGADVAQTYAVSKTLGAAAAVATKFAPIIWVIDNGAIWPGISGTVTYTISAQVEILLRDHNHFVCSTDYSLILLSSYAAHSNAGFFKTGLCYTKGLKVDCSAHTSTYGSWQSFSQTSTHVNFWLVQRRRWVGTILGGNGTQIVFHSPKIELLDATNAVATFLPGAYGGGMTVFGGEISGAGATTNSAVFTSSSNSHGFESYGLKFPRVMDTSGAKITSGSTAVMNGCDGTFGNIYMDQACNYDSRADAYYPTLNAFLETNGANAWSYKMYPFNACLGTPGRIQISKTYTQAAAAKKVTLEILWPITGGLGAATSDKIFIVVQYVDNSTGLKVTQTTQNMAATALTASGATWEPSTAYGPTFFDPYLIELTTGSAIKQDTEVIVSLFVTAKSSTTDDVLIIDPDPILSTP